MKLSRSVKCIGQSQLSKFKERKNSFNNKNAALQPMEDRGQTDRAATHDKKINKKLN